MTNVLSKLSHFLHLVIVGSIYICRLLVPIQTFFHLWNHRSMRETATMKKKLTQVHWKTQSSGTNDERRVITNRHTHYCCCCCSYLTVSWFESTHDDNDKDDGEPNWRRNSGEWKKESATPVSAVCCPHLTLPRLFARSTRCNKMHPSCTTVRVLVLVVEQRKPAHQRLTTTASYSNHYPQCGNNW